MQEKKEWFASWFDSHYYHLLYKNRDDQEAAHFIDNLLEKLSPPFGSKVLDLACGKGRHSIYLAGKGFDVTGVDLSLESISAAKQNENKRLKFYQHDMREPFKPSAFDYIFNLFTSFGYFDNDEDHQTTLENNWSGLKPGGTLVIDFMNAAKVVTNLVLSESKIVEDLQFDITRSYTNGYIVKDIRFSDNGRTFHFTESVRAFSLSDFETMLKSVGFDITNVFGNYDLQPFEVELSPRLILFAKKHA
ncbi:MAG: class I SAM-dependent methyltransferase [Bacteroidota bacterium]